VASSAAAAPHRTLHPSSGQTCSATEGVEPSLFDADSLVVGPMAIGGAVWAERQPAEAIREGHGQKLPVVVRWRHEVTITLARSARSYARLEYGRHRAFRRMPVRVRFVACKHAHRHGGSAPPDTIPATFFPGGLRVKRAPACVPMSIRIDLQAPVRRTVGLGTHCPES
jgi:hypothetical protein